MSINNDRVVRKLDKVEALKVHKFNVGLGSANKGFYRWYEDEDFFQERNGLIYHYLEYNDKDFRVEYVKSQNKKYTFTGNVVEIDTENKMKFNN